MAEWFALGMTCNTSAVTHSIRSPSEQAAANGNALIAAVGQEQRIGSRDIPREQKLF
jgi:hypothetical protein